MDRNSSPQIFSADPMTGFVSASEAKKAIVIAEQQIDGSVRFVSAGMLFESADPAKINAISQPRTEGAEMDTTSSKTALTWVVTVIPIIAAIAGATAWINSTIDSKSRDNRLEMKQDLQLAKQDITSRVDKVETKVDAGFKDTSNQFNELKTLLIKKDN